MEGKAPWAEGSSGGADMEATGLRAPHGVEEGVPRIQHVQGGQNEGFGMTPDLESGNRNREVLRRNWCV